MFYYTSTLINENWIKTSAVFQFSYWWSSLYILSITYVVHIVFFWEEVPGVSKRIFTEHVQESLNNEHFQAGTKKPVSGSTEHKVAPSGFYNSRRIWRVERFAASKGDLLYGNS